MLENITATVVFYISCPIPFKVIVDKQTTISYAAHAFGGLAGLLVGTLLLENRKVRIYYIALNHE